MTKDDIVKYINTLKDNCLEEAQANAMNIDSIICYVRKYNRMWNELAENEPAMIKDGFSKLMKSIFQSDASQFSAEEKKRFDYL